MTRRFAHVPVLLMRLRGVPTCEQQEQDFLLRTWIGITAGLVAFWCGLAAWVFSL